MYVVVLSTIGGRLEKTSEGMEKHKADIIAEKLNKKCHWTRTYLVVDESKI